MPGDEFYSKEWPELEGMPFSTVILKFPLATPIGMESDGSVTLNPEDSYILKPDMSSASFPQGFHWHI